MVQSRRLNLDVHPNEEVGVSANAFRVLAESEDWTLLDFLTYVEEEGRAIVVARIKVPTTLLFAFRAQLVEVLHANKLASHTTTSLPTGIPGTVRGKRG